MSDELMKTLQELPLDQLRARLVTLREQEKIVQALVVQRGRIEEERSRRRAWQEQSRQELASA